VRRALSAGTPGGPGGLLGRPEPALPVEPAPPGPLAAVLVPLFESDGETRVVLTRRSSALRSHTGEVSFPGGRVDPGESLEEAALREASEEVGIEPAAVEVVGRLTPLRTMASGATIFPFVGALSHRPALRPSPLEVELAFDVALADLAAEGTYREEQWALPELGDRAVHFFELPEDTVWGATARILHELLGAVLSAAPAGGLAGPAPGPGSPAWQ
jgi:8-oxo-dGTP pyrophosphatase MutT (NUDIX family)